MSEHSVTTAPASSLNPTILTTAMATAQAALDRLRTLIDFGMPAQIEDAIDDAALVCKAAVGKLLQHYQNETRRLQENLEASDEKFSDVESKHNDHLTTMHQSYQSNINDIKERHAREMATNEEDWAEKHRSSRERCIKLVASSKQQLLDAREEVKKPKDEQREELVDHGAMLKASETRCQDLELKVKAAEDHTEELS